MRFLPMTLVVVAISVPVMAQGLTDRTREMNALRDIARAQERQADELRRLRQIEGDRARQADRDSRAADALSRSSRRFDRH